MKIVLDTNVLVSGLLTPYGSSGEIMRMVSSGQLTLCYDARILAEYRDVLLRPRFRFNKDNVASLLDYIQHAGLLHTTRPLPEPLPDEDDEPFLEVALAAKVCCLVTGNRDHFPQTHVRKIRILSPTEFLQYFRREQGGAAD